MAESGVARATGVSTVAGKLDFINGVGFPSIPQPVREDRCRIGCPFLQADCHNFPARVGFKKWGARVTTPNQPSIPASQPKQVSAWVCAFRCLRWSTYLAALITLILILHKPAPPPIQVSQQAAASAEQKFSEVEQSVSRGEPG